MNATDIGQPFEVTPDGYLIVTSETTVKKNLPYKFVGDKTVAIATGTDEVHGLSIEYADAGEEFAINLDFKGKPYRGVATSELIVSETEPTKIKPTGNLVNGLPEFEAVGVDETTQFTLVHGASQANDEIIFIIL